MITPITVIAALQLFSRAVHAQPRTFDADQAVALDGGAAGNRLGVPLVRNTAAGDASGEDDDDVELERQDLISVGKFIRTCDCTIAETVVRCQAASLRAFARAASGKGTGSCRECVTQLGVVCGVADGMVCESNLLEQVPQIHAIFQIHLQMSQLQHITR